MTNVSRRAKKVQVVHDVMGTPAVEKRVYYSVKYNCIALSADSIVLISD